MRKIQLSLLLGLAFALPMVGLANDASQPVNRPTLRQDAKSAGATIKKDSKIFGTAVKHTAIKIGHAAKEFGVKVAAAAKQGAHELHTKTKD